MEVNIDPKIEQFTKEIIFKDLSRGDPNRDVPHTEAVAHYVKEIIKTLPADAKIDPTVLILAAYAHDWGYTPFFREGKSLEYDEYMEAKKKHMDIGAEMVKKLLTDQTYDSLTAAQKSRIVCLVQIHDALDKLVGEDALILQEADTLGGLDTDYMKPEFDQASNEKYMNSVRNKRLPLFTTEYSKNIFESLYKKRQNYYKSKS